MPKRIQMSRQKPWRVDNPGAVRVDRTTPYGNPFRVIQKPCEDSREGGRCWAVMRNHADYEHRDTKREALVAAVDLFRERVGYMDIDVSSLAGRDLACWCPHDQPCHADVLLELANPTEGNTHG